MMDCNLYRVFTGEGGDHVIVLAYSAAEALELARASGVEIRCWPETEPDVAEVILNDRGVEVEPHG